jgi:hypothetical protein
MAKIKMASGGARTGAGRPKGKVSEAKRTIAEAARGQAEAALKVLIDVAKDSDAPAAARVSAANAILDRGYGKPVAQFEHTGKDGAPIQTETTTRVVIVPAKIPAAPTVRPMTDDEVEP